MLARPSAFEWLAFREQQGFRHQREEIQWLLFGSRLWLDLCSRCHH